MQKAALTLSFLFLVWCTLSAQNVGIGTSQPDPSAQLEVQASDKGFLPPRVALSATNLASPVVNPAAGLLVYNTATNGATPYNVKPGYYYWNGNLWTPVVNRGTVYGDMQYWDGSRWINIPLGLNGQVLTICNGVPQWGPCFQRLTLKPVNNEFEGFISSNIPAAFAQSDQLLIEAWTIAGDPLTARALVKFDMSTIPANAVVDSARLYLYADSFPANANQVDPHFGSGNGCFVQRITTAWTVPTQFSWNNPPSVTTANQVFIPASTNAFQDEVVDVTAMVQDQLVQGNNGYLIRLQTESIYRCRQYESSRSVRTNRLPRLEVFYH